MASSSSTLTKANTTFCLDLFKELGNANTAANLFFSPFSISSAMAMVMLGASGNTETQMSEVLKFTEAGESRPGRGEQQRQQQQQRRRQQQCQQQQVQCNLPPHVLERIMNKNSTQNIHEEFNQLLKQLNKAEAPYALSVANRLYGERTFDFVQDYLEETKTYYDAGLESVDFINSFEMVRANINTWVEEQTQGKIKGILAEGAVSNMTRLVLVNAIYFKGDWNKQFKENATRDAQFRLNKNETKTVKMMNQKAKFPFNFVEELNLQILELPYKNEELSMLVFLPMDIEDNSTGLEKLENALSYDSFMEWTNPERMDVSEVQVDLPRFKMVEKYDMKRFLSNMGMVDVFDAALSDLSGMSTVSDLVVSKVVHKAFVDVNEEGTEAAAATAVTIGVTSVRPSNFFTADHPFLFFIRHNASKSVLFAGRFCSPE